MSFEEDTYDTIFKAMQHPIRRRILRMIGEKPATYTEIQKELNIDNGLLNYHLEALSSLITKNSEEKYALSDFGKATVSLVKGVEEPMRQDSRSRFKDSKILKLLVPALAIVVLLTSALAFDYYSRYSSLSLEVAQLRDKNTQLEAVLGEFNLLRRAWIFGQASALPPDTTTIRLSPEELVGFPTVKEYIEYIEWRNWVTPNPCWSINATEAISVISLVSGRDTIGLSRWTPGSMWYSFRFEASGKVYSLSIVFSDNQPVLD